METDHEGREVIDAPNGDPKLRGTITDSVAISGTQIGALIPAPDDHPAWEDELAVATRPTGGGLVIARDLDDVERLLGRTPR